MLRNLFGEVASEASLRESVDNLTLLLASILEKLPRVDTADRMTVAIESGSVGLSAGQTLATLTTVSSVSSLANLVNVGGRDVAHASFALANSGCMHIYDNIKVT